MQDSTWLRVYGNKWLYSNTGIRADGGGIRTNQICNTSGGNCIAQSALAGSSGSLFTQCTNENSDGDGYLDISACVAATNVSSTTYRPDSCRYGTGYTTG